MSQARVVYERLDSFTILPAIGEDGNPVLCAHSLALIFHCYQKEKKKKNVDVGFNRFITKEPNLFADNSKILGDS